MCLAIDELREEAIELGRGEGIEIGTKRIDRGKCL